MEQFEHEPHVYKSSRRTPFITACVKCGLVSSNAQFAQWADKVGCNNRYHPSYQSQRSKTSPFK